MEENGVISIIFKEIIEQLNIRDIRRDLLDIKYEDLLEVEIFSIRTINFNAFSEIILNGNIANLKSLFSFKGEIYNFVSVDYYRYNQETLFKRIQEFYEENIKPYPIDR